MGEQKLKQSSRMTMIQNALTYSPGEGLFRWKKNGKLAKIIRLKDDHGYARRVISGEGLFIDTVEAAWILGYGTEPDGPVVFIDGDSNNLKLRNLAVARGTIAHEIRDAVDPVNEVSYRIRRAAREVMHGNTKCTLMWLRMAMLAIDGVRDAASDRWMKEQG